MKLDVFGRHIEVLRENDEWILYMLGEGKKRRDLNIVIPSELSEKEVIDFVADIYHEAATPENPDVKVID